jgi:hypothetical protein
MIETECYVSQSAVGVIVTLAHNANYWSRLPSVTNLRPTVTVHPAHNTRRPDNSSHLSDVANYCLKAADTPADKAGYSHYRKYQTGTTVHQSDLAGN